MSDRWDRAFLELALTWSRMSKDPNTRVGSVIVGPGREVLSMGFNGFPHGVADTPARLKDRETKNRLMVHAERNAICLAARRGVALQRSTLYLAATDDSMLVWGGPPCTACTIEIMQAGIVRVVSFPKKNVPSKWHDDLEFAESLLAEAGVEYTEIATHDLRP